MPHLAFCVCPERERERERLSCILLQVSIAYRLWLKWKGPLIFSNGFLVVLSSFASIKLNKYTVIYIFIYIHTQICFHEWESILAKRGKVVQLSLMQIEIPFLKWEKRACIRYIRYMQHVCHIHDHGLLVSQTWKKNI